MQHISTTFSSFGLKLMFCGILLSLFSFRSSEKKTIQFICELQNATQKDSLFLYQFNGIGFEPYIGVGTKDGKKFQFDVPAGEATFYYVGTKDVKVKSVLLGEEKEVAMTGDFRQMRRAKIAEGMNALYNNSMEDSRRLRNEQITLSQQFRKVIADEKQRKEVEAEMLEVDNKKRALLKSITKENAFIGKIMGLYTYYSFQNSNTKNYPHELAYFAGEYLAQANLRDADYDRVPMVYDAFNSFTTMLCKTNAFSKEQLDQVLSQNLNRVDDQSSTYRFALGGMTAGLKAQNNPLFIDYGTKFIEKYPKDTSPSMERFRKQVAISKGFLPGAVAPDFTLNTPEGEPLSLSDLRGKVVLVDFWASWCGPCRKENPHVVALYNKYKDKGFDVLGVSLDKDMPRWKAAIEKDGLEWHHISDLKGWRNEVAQMYSVSSIPHTLLLDAEGRIIGRKLRAHQLEAKLKEIFGE